MFNLINETAANMIGSQGSLSKKKKERNTDINRYRAKGIQTHPPVYYPVSNGESKYRL